MKNVRVETREGSPHWQAIFEYDGQRKRTSLKVEVRGKHPDPKTGTAGSPEYYRSRDIAMQEAAKLYSNIHEEANERRLIKKAFSIKTDRPMQSLRISALFKFWEEHVLQAASPNPRHVQVVKTWFWRLWEFVRKNNPQANLVAHISLKDALGFYNHWAKEVGLAPKTCRNGLYLMRQTFEVLVIHEMVSANVFKGVNSEAVATVSKKPYTDEELLRIFAVVKNDEDWRLFVKLLLLSALRLGDACKVRWIDVLFADGYVAGIQSKTQNGFVVPLYQPLETELIKRYRAMGRPDHQSYVFPDFAEQYRKGTMSESFGRILERAGFSQDVTSPRALRVTPKRGVRAINIRGAHAFRATLATRAYLAGVPVEMIRQVTGHTSIALEKHYLKPTAAEIQKTIAGKLPGLMRLATSISANKQPGKRKNRK